MEITYHKVFSGVLNQEFEFKRYGRAGKPVMVFPCSGGRFFDYENFGMLDIFGPSIESGDLQLVCVDSRDHESWLKPVHDEWMAKRHEHFEGCIINDVIPFLRKEGIDEKFLATGNSAGAWHAMNFFLKYPGCFDSAISLSGFYSIKAEIGDYYDRGVYFNDILRYLPGITDEAALAKLRYGYAIIAHGGGAWETFNDEARLTAALLAEKGITVWYNPWGTDWPHDWCTWKAQLSQYLPRLRDGVDFKGGILRLTGPQRRVNKLECQTHAG
ncbi:MAG: alpha/beta hydrolase-fold protein [Elusimicrobiales bacterium]|nr:alpha/beta hydrolase-fold protein [Elusimicrobiales bacterium]